MCTLTVIPTSSELHGVPIAVRVMCNRDESRRRPQATPPQIERFGDRLAILPRDPQAGGTWIAVNDAGLAMILLNAQPQPGVPPSPGATSRGAIIPALLDASSLAVAIARALRIDAAIYAPFRLVMLNRHEAAELVSADSRLMVRQRTNTMSPLMYTSSGLGDQLVTGPRRKLFDEFLRPGLNWIQQQDSFHRHRWPGREDISVAMRRAEAQTVSRTVIDMDEERVQLIYYGAPPDEEVEPITLALSTTPTAALG